MILLGSPLDPARRDFQGPHRESEKSSRALFLDRDGVLNHDFGYVGSKENFEFIQPTISLIRWAVRHGYIVVLVTNQSGIGRGFFSLNQFEELMNWVDGELQKLGCDIVACYFSPNDPEGPGQTESSFERKPSPDMVLAAVADFELEVQKCILVGDKFSDVVAGQQAGVGNLVLVGGKANLHQEDKHAYSIDYVSDVSETLTLLPTKHSCDLLCQDSQLSQSSAAM